MAYPFELPDLPYEYDALEPHIDEQTMRIHHGKHHAGYTSKLNAALEDHGSWHDRSAVDILRDIQQVPEAARTAVRNNGGGYVNHAIFWQVMSPDGGGSPSGSLAGAIDRAFGGVDSFKERLTAAAGGVFGSGWGWLVNDGGELKIVGRPNQDSPYMDGQTPLLGVDVWEHAYYLKYQNRRPDYLQAWWNVVNWKEVNRRFEESQG